MNFVGKILIVLQLLLAFCFLGFAGAVVATQTNWRERATTLQADVQKARQDQQTVQSDLDRFKTEMTLQLGQQKDRADRFEAESNNLKQQVASLEQRNRSLATSLDTQQALAELSAKEAEFRTGQAREQSSVNKTLRDSRNELAEQVRSLEDKLWGIELQQKQMIARHERLLRENEDLKSYLRQQGLEYDPALLTSRSAPPSIDGRVLDARRADKSRNEYVEVSLGSDDGLLEGHELFAYRDDKYLGKIRIVYTDPDRAVGVIVEKAKNTKIERGDHVTTKL